MAQIVREAIPSIKRGTLRFLGEWFGRPYDNWHQITGAEAENGVLRLLFDQGESLSVWAPSGLKLDPQTFRIADAEHVRWEGYSYGRAKTAENLYFMDFVKTAGAVVATTNVDWYVPELKPGLNFPAVEIL
jgi:hypothetical protein